MTKIEEIKDKINKGHYIFAKESYYGTTWLDSEAEEDVEYLLSIIEKSKNALEWYANGWNYVIGSDFKVAIIEDDGKHERQTLKEDAE